MPPTKVARASTGDAAADDTATAVESGAERVSAAERSSGLQDLASAGMPPLGHAPFLVVALAFFSAIMTGTDSLTAQFVLALLVMTTTFGLIASFGAKSTPAGTASGVALLVAKTEKSVKTVKTVTAIAGALVLVGDFAFPDLVVGDVAFLIFALIVIAVLSFRFILGVINLTDSNPKKTFKLSADTTAAAIAVVSVLVGGGARSAVVAGAAFFLLALLAVTSLGFLAAIKPKSKIKPTVRAAAGSKSTWLSSAFASSRLSFAALLIVLSLGGMSAAILLENHNTFTTCLAQASTCTTLYAPRPL